MNSIKVVNIELTQLPTVMQWRTSPWLA